MMRDEHRFLRRLSTVLFAAVIALASAAPVSAADGYHITFPGHMAGTSGRTAYFAVGIDGGGPLYKYNSAAKKKTAIADGKWCWLNVRGSKLYLTKNNHMGSDGRCYYIYSMKTNGKSRKKLASGFNPVVRGKYIYYIATEKATNYGVKVDSRQKGIYRMKLNGKGKKCLVRAGSGDSFSLLGVTSGGLVFKKNNTWYKCSFKGKNLRDIDIWNYSSNITHKDYDNYSDFDSYSAQVRVKSGNKEYFGTDNIVRTYQYTEGEHVNNDVATVKGTVQKIIISGSHMMVFSRYTSGYNYKYNVYMMKKSGAAKKKVTGGVEVSGGWDY